MTIRVLLFDDDPAVRITLERWLASQGDMRVVGRAGDGDEAVAVAARTPADVIIMDVKMPGRSGLDATRAIRSRGIRTPVVILTADDAAENEVAGLEGASFLWKGRVGPREALGAIRRAAGPAGRRGAG